MKISRKDKKLLIFTLLFCLFVCYGNFVFKPRYDRLKFLHKEISRKERFITETHSAVKRDRGVPATSNISLFNDIVPKTKESESLLKTIDMVIAKGGMQQISISFGEESRQKLSLEGDNFSYNMLPVDIHLKGTYSQAINTLALLENQKRFFNYKSLDMVADEKGNINLSISLKYYSMGKNMGTEIAGTQ
jgi:Tfp pilus assembly protein PilO